MLCVRRGWLGLEVGECVGVPACAGTTDVGGFRGWGVVGEKGAGDSSRGLGMTVRGGGGCGKAWRVGGAWGFPPLILREPQHERPHRPGITLTLALSHRGRGDRRPLPAPREWGEGIWGGQLGAAGGGEFWAEGAPGDGEDEEGGGE